MSSAFLLSLLLLRLPFFTQIIQAHIGTAPELLRAQLGTTGGGGGAKRQRFLRALQETKTELRYARVGAHLVAFVERLGAAVAAGDALGGEASPCSGALVDLGPFPADQDARLRWSYCLYAPYVFNLNSTLSYPKVVARLF